MKILSEIPEESGDRLKDEEIKNLKFYQGKKCDFCNNTGYKGRIGIFEIFPMDETIEKIILEGKVSEYDMREIIIKNGMVTMIQDGMLKAKDGITSVEEVLRVSQ
jgi:type IV pilus assembly protein PilB